MKDVQAIGEAFSPQKRTFSNSKQNISSLFCFFVGNFCLPESVFCIPNADSDPANQNQCGFMQTRIYNSGWDLIFMYSTVDFLL